MYSKFIKRILDLIFSIISLPFLLIIILVIGVLIKIDDKGPIFYKAKRIGKNSKIFAGTSRDTLCPFICAVGLQARESLR